MGKPGYFNDDDEGEEEKKKPAKEPAEDNPDEDTGDPLPVGGLEARPSHPRRQSLAPGQQSHYASHHHR
jgi:hypothetical protein